MNNRKHLSIYGIGPLYVVLSSLLTTSAYLMERFQLIPVLSFQSSELMLKILSIGCILVAAILWINALFVQKIDRCILNNQLVMTGAYAWVRNPIYSAIMLIMWAFLAWRGNLVLLLFCPVYPLLMSVLLKHTEEKWLLELYGQTYMDYCKQVNRCIPWFPKQ